MKEEKEIRQMINHILIEAKEATEKEMDLACMILLEKAGVLNWVLK